MLQLILNQIIDPLNMIGWKLPQNLIKGFSQLKLYRFKTKINLNNCNIF